MGKQLLSIEMDCLELDCLQTRPLTVPQGNHGRSTGHDEGPSKDKGEEQNNQNGYEPGLAQMTLAVLFRAFSAVFSFEPPHPHDPDQPGDGIIENQRQEN